MRRWHTLTMTRARGRPLRINAAFLRPHREDIPRVRRQTHARRAGVLFDAVAVLVVVVVPLQPLSVFDHLGHQARATPTVATVPCKIGQLDIVYYGGSGAAGTAITGFKVTNSSKVACVLGGYPTVSFFTGTTSAPRAASSHRFAPRARNRVCCSSAPDCHRTVRDHEVGQQASRACVHIGRFRLRRKRQLSACHLDRRPTAGCRAGHAGLPVVPEPCV